MASEQPSSAWHPALMPDHEDPASNQHDQEPHSSPPGSPDSLHNGTPLEPPEPHGFDLSVAESGDGDNWFAKEDGEHGEHDDGGAWLLSDQSGGLQQGVDAAADASQQHVAPSSDPTQQPASLPDPTKTPSKAQHGSSMSFARTVSHEISFADDDEGDWNLSRTGTDPFKFMPPNDRTNSFPAVPPMASDPSHVDQPLSSYQALDALEESDHDSSFESHRDELPNGDESHATESAAPSQNRVGRPPSGSIGGQVQGFEGEAADARYAEGVPLIPRSTSNDASEEKHDNDPFAEDDDDNDDGFFSQTPSANHQNAPPPLERKSTAQVMSTLGPGTFSRQDTLETTHEEDEATPPPAAGNNANGTIDAKWQEAFGGGDDDDDFLLDDKAGETKSIDAEAFLGSDDEGLLDDTEDAPQPAMPAQAPASTYAPQQQATGSPYQPAAPSYMNAPAPVNAFGSALQYGQRPPPSSTPDPIRAQSFADKSKGGYSSPYDLPDDIASTVPKPRKRPSTQSLRGAPAASPVHPTFGRSVTAAPGPPPVRDHSQEPPKSRQGSVPVLRNKNSFFEELPMQPKPRQPSRTRTQSPSHFAPPPPGPPGGTPSVPPTPASMQPPPPPPTREPSGIANLVAPERVSPYAALQNGPSPIPAPSNNTARYSPAPAQGAQGIPVPAAAGTRYSPAPSAPRTLSGYSPTRSSVVTPPILPHQPRTSSPLAHFEMHGSGHVPHERRSSSSSYEPRLHRVPSLPPTREVDEEDDHSGAGASLTTHTPPPTANYPSSAMSPPKRTERAGSSYFPYPNQTQSQQTFVPPPRSQTQSPGSTFGKRPGIPSSDSSRPSSAHAPTSPVAKKMTGQATAQPTRGRGISQSLNMVPPTDGREQDPLQRWRGVPVIAWGVGGTIVTSFPKSIPRYTMGAAQPALLRVPGEVHVKNIKDVEPLPERLAKFPGPLKGKSKKKETISWLTFGIEVLEKDLPDVTFHPQLSLEAKRTLERLLLWKILRVFIENDGVLEGTPAVEKAVRDVLSPGTVTPTSDNDAMFPGDPRLGNLTAPVTSMQADGADGSAMEQIRLSLLKGDRETAVWSAVDKRLWGHAMIMAHTVSPDLYKKVAQEFVRKEVNHAGHANESLGALYMVLSGNHDDSVDELVPSHARAGFQLVSTEASSNPNADVMDGLDKWRETLTLILSNRSTEDVHGLQSLGKLLASYGRAEAAHICFLFSRNISVFGGADDPNVNFVLLGSDFRRQENETEALQLSEVYEYGLSLAGSMYSGAPHLAAYKLRHAVSLAEYGYREKALQYCDAITAAMGSQTKRSPYYNAYLAGAVDDFVIRLKQAPKGDSGSWISKPSMNKVSDSMWNKFNKFVAGDDGAEGNAANATNGPFAAVGSPNMSRSPSVNNFDMYASAPSPYTPAPTASVPLTGAASKYAPAVAPQSSSAPNPYEAQYAPPTPATSGSDYPGYPGQAQPTAYPPIPTPVENGGYAPPGYTPLTQPDSAPTSGGYQPRSSLAESVSMPTLAESPMPDKHEVEQPAYSPASFGYEPPQLNTISPEGETNDHSAEGGAGGYEAPSYQPYGYEPPSYQPDYEPNNDGEESPKAKKKSWGDDDDDIPAMTQDKSKADKDRENDELFRKAAEEDGKFAQNPLPATQTDMTAIAKRAAEQQAGKKSWGFGGWFGKRAESPKPGAAEPKAVRANLGEASSFVYDPDLKRWVNKKPGAENVEAKKGTPPPPKGGPRSMTATPPPMSGTPPPPSLVASRSVSGGSANGPPRSVPPPGTPELRAAPSTESLRLPPLAPPMSRSASGASAAGGDTGSRPTTSMSNASSIDDLLSAPGPRKGGAKKSRKSGRYVDVMAK